MKRIIKRLSILMISTLFICVFTQGKIAIAESSSQLEINGTVDRLLMDPNGQADGFLLQGHTQVNFEPQMSKQITAIVAAKDKVDIKGFRLNKNVFEAEIIVNLKTKKSVALTSFSTETHSPPLNRRQRFSVHGKIKTQLFGRQGGVNGVILSDSTIVVFAPHFLEESDVNTDVGERLQATGLGTKNSKGLALQATYISNDF